MTASSRRTSATRSASKVRFVDSGIRGNTVVPEHIIPGGVAGVLSCFHPSCYNEGGRRAHFGLGDLLPEGKFTALPLKEFARIWGFKVASLDQPLFRRATVPLVKADERRDEFGNLVAYYCAGDVEENPSVARRLARCIDEADQ